MKQIYVESYYRNGYSRFMKHSSVSINHSGQGIAEERLKIIQFFDEFGAEATRKAFNKSRSTIYLWKQKLRKANGRIAALASGSRAPIHRRRRVVHPFIEAFILKYRADHPGADKTTITPALVATCNSAGIKPVSESTIGRIIHDLKQRGRLPKSNKITINARTGKLLVRERKKPRQKERRKGFRPQLPGDVVQMDTVSVFASGIKRYIFTAIDVSTRFAFACAYPSNSSANGSDFLRKFIQVAPFNTARIQTDNGGEFEKYFDKTCQENGLVHFFNYPKHPQSNGCLERFNKTIQEQFVYWHIDYLDEIASFNRKMMDYLIWYNTEKPHRGIGNLSPLRYYINNFLTPPQKSNMLWTLTRDDILEGLEGVRKDKEARVLVLGGAGRCFSAGGDMETMQIVQQSALAADKGARSYLDVVLAIRGLDIPTISKINGDAYGGGACIALACDFKIASEEAKLGFAFIRVGLSGADAGATYLLPRMVGINKAIELLMLSQVISAQEAVKIGLVHRTVPAAELDRNVDELARRLASGPPVALRLTKRALWNSLDREILSEFDFEAYVQGVCFQTDDHKEGVKAFLEKRPPDFKGR